MIINDIELVKLYCQIDEFVALCLALSHLPISVGGVVFFISSFP